ncbi:MAG: hypothetical protein K2X46_00090, partial [Roseomonas sp.]|nr:hypothetical protein [Roseomonas sp.]
MSGTFTIGSTSTSEGDGGGAITAQFLVQRSGPVDQAWTGYWTVSPTGTNPAGLDDFFGTAFPSGTVTFAAGSRSAFISITRRGDTTVEPDETFRIDLAATSGGTPIASGIVTIQDDDNWYRIVAPPASITEGADAVFTVRRSLATEAVTLTWTAAAPGSSGVASAADFGLTGAFPTGTITFAVGETSKQFVVRPILDGRIEGSENVEIRLSGMPDGAVRTSTGSFTTRITDGEAGVSISASQSSLVEGQPGSDTATETSFLFQVTRTSGSGEQSVDWAVTGSGTAPANAADFVGGVLPSGRVTFADGETTRTIEVKVAGDLTPEADDRFTVTLSNPSGGLAIATATASSTIVNDDTPATFTIGAGVESRAEGQSGTWDFQFLVSRSGATAVTHDVGWRVVLPGDGSLTAADFGTGALSGTLRFAPGDSLKMISLPVRGDRTPEASEALTVEIFAPNDDPNVQIETGTATTIITDDDVTYRIVADAAAVREGEAGTTPFSFTISRTGPATTEQELDWRVALDAGSTTNAADFDAASLSGTITLAAGEASRIITIDVAGDTEWEGDERFRVQLLSPGTSTVLASTTATILNDETRFDIQSASVQRAEGNTGTTPFTFTVTRAGLLAEAATVAWAVAGTGTVPADAADFAGGVLPTGTLTFAAGETSRTITVNVAGDRVAERAERFTVTLSTTEASHSLDDASALGIILADDSSVAITAHQAVRTEGHPGASTPFTFHVTRTGATDTAQSVAWSVAGVGTSRAGASDFVGGVAPSGVVEFAVGETRQTITVNVAGDSSRELDETFAVRLSAPTNGLLIGQAEAQGTILRDETVMSIASTTGSAAEGTGGTTPFTFTVTRTGYVDAVQTASWSVINSGSNAASAA